MATSSPIAVKTMTSKEISGRSQSIYESLTGILFLFSEQLRNLLTSFTIRQLDIVFGVASIGNEGEEAIVADVKLR